MRSGVFLLRSEVGKLVASRNGQPNIDATLKWGELNRVTSKFALNMALPRIDASWIGVPLYFVKVDYGGATAVTITPSGRSIDRQSTPKINDAASYSATAVKLYTFITDGQNWYAT